MSLSSSRESIDGSVDSYEQGKRQTCRCHSPNPSILADDWNENGVTCDSGFYQTCGGESLQGSSAPPPEPRTTSFDGCFYKIDPKNGEDGGKLTITALNDKTKYEDLSSPVSRVKNWLSNLFGNNGGHSTNNDNKYDALEMLQKASGGDQDDKLSVSSSVTTGF